MAVPAFWDVRMWDPVLVVQSYMPLFNIVIIFTKNKTYTDSCLQSLSNDLTIDNVKKYNVT